MTASEMEDGRIARRQFLSGLAWAGAGAFAAPALGAALNPDAGRNASGLPMRILGRTKEKVTILGLGAAPVGHSQPGAASGVPVYRAALEAGVNYVDTAHAYDDAESYLGELVPQYRDRIFLVTKSQPAGANPRDAVQEMQRQFEQSLRLMKTDHVDLLHIHSVGDRPTDLILAADGPLEFVRKLKEKGQTRFIGITGHNRVSRYAPIIETGEIDVIMVPLNFADYHTYRFEEDILPLARKHQCGVVAMKVFGGHRNNFAGYRRRGPSKMPAPFLERALRYSLSIEGVAAAVVGPYTIEEAKQNVEWARRFQPVSPEERRELRAAGAPLAAEWGPRFGPAV